MNIIKYNKLPQGGFAGIVEKQLAKSSDLWPQLGEKKTSNGLGDFIYLSMGHFKANDGAPLHPHKDVDIVSFIYTGEIGHKGSLGDGTVIESPGVQVQRAGSGMTHSEFSTNDNNAKFAQIWFVPPKNGLAPGYKDFSITDSGLTTVHGGDENTFNSNMICKIGFIEAGNTIEIKGDYVAVLFDGSLSIDGVEICERDLFEGSDLSLKVTSRIGLILIQENKG
jgi:redox-sensitive bicupin YhaK (pirin superfamily)